MCTLAIAASTAVLPPEAAGRAGAAAPFPGVALRSPQPASRPVAAAPAASVMPPVRTARLPESGRALSPAALSIDLLLSSAMSVLSDVETVSRTTLV